MLILPRADELVRIMSFDPGTETLGMAISDVNLSSGVSTVVHAETFKASKYVSNRDGYLLTQEMHGDRQARLQSHSNNVFRHLYGWRPHLVISESPFMGMRAQAFEALVECVGMLRWTVQHYDPTLYFDVVSPMSAKKAVGASGRGMDKHDVKRRLIELCEEGQLAYIGTPPLVSLDEHSIDAIAVGRALAVSLM